MLNWFALIWLSSFIFIWPMQWYGVEDDPITISSVQSCQGIKQVITGKNTYLWSK